MTTREALPDLVAAVERGEVGAATHGSFHRYSATQGRHVWWSDAAVALLADELRSLPVVSWVEVGAGDGSLAHALAAHRLRVTPTDGTPAPGVAVGDVAALAAAGGEDGVLCVFPPSDAAFCAALVELSRRVPLLLVSPELDGRLTCGDAIADGRGRRGRRVAALEAELVCKHDFCQVLGDAATLVRHARAWSIVPDPLPGRSPS
jgi:hypothetical protein